jgi:alpha-beta hydrolase superfamily lysophospholipase
LHYSDGLLAPTLLGENGEVELFYRRWLPDSKPPVAILLIVHGMGEHSGRYEHVADYFVKLGFGVYALDHIGHGRSPGERVYVSSFSEFTHGLTAFSQHVQSEYADKPLFLVGHSLGGLISSVFLLENQSLFDGCILSGAAIEIPEKPSFITYSIVDFFAKFFPKMGMLRLDSNGISRDASVVDKYLNDPLVSKRKLPARTLSEVIKTMTEIQSKAAEIDIPVLIMHGQEDRLTAVEGSKLLFEKVSSRDKSLLIYPNLYHEIFNEPEKEKVLTDVKDWLQKRIVK